VLMLPSVMRSYSQDGLTARHWWGKPTVRSVGVSESSFQLCQILVGKGWMRREDDGVVAAVLGGFGDGW
jgi:hypothetical protein